MENQQQHETFQLRKARRGFIVYRPLEHSSDVGAVLLDEDGKILYTAIVTHPHYAFSELWATRDTRQFDNPGLMVDPYAYDEADFKKRFPYIYAAMNVAARGW